MIAKTIYEIKGVMLAAVRNEDINEAVLFRNLVTWNSGPCGAVGLGAPCKWKNCRNKDVVKETQAYLGVAGCPGSGESVHLGITMRG